MPQPNAFATGRNPDHAAVAVTQGILQILDERELRGVLAHELSHVENRDILIGRSPPRSACASRSWRGSRSSSAAATNNRGGGVRRSSFAWILAPLAAALIQMAVSRSREYQADESGAYLSHDPEALASALRKLEQRLEAGPAAAPRVARPRRTCSS